MVHVFYCHESPFALEQPCGPLNLVPYELLDCILAPLACLYFYTSFVSAILLLSVYLCF